MMTTMESNTIPTTPSPEEHLEEPSNEDLRAISRRSAIKLLGGAGLALIAACAADPVGATTTTALSGSSSTAGAAATTATTFGGDGSCVLIPEETEGPYPLDLSGSEEFLRSDIAEGRPGVPLTLTLSLVDVNAGCAPISGARVDVWHCDADGVYSGYSQPGTDTIGETFCRGIQVSDDNGQVTFQTIYPGWYQGRITHIHFQVFFESGLTATSQIAFPEEITAAVYAVDPYAAKGPNTSVTSFAQDNVFSDGTQYQMATVTGGADARYVATMLVGMAGGTN
jgi:protocatechuate 3,4-dioxygenase beta subunit